MRDGPPGFPQGSTCPAVLRNQTREPLSFRLRGLHPVSPAIPDRSATKSVSYSPTLLPQREVRPCNTLDTTPAGLTYRRFGLFPLRSPLLGESHLLSFPPGTEMVHFPGLSSQDLCIQSWILRYEPEWVAPFGNLRVKACLRLAGAYRSLPRPSSPSCAKASTVRP